MILAHSQGAAVVLDALGGMILEPDEKRESEMDALGRMIFELDKKCEPGAASRVVLDALVTFGAGTNQLASQKVLSAGLPKTFGTNPVLGAVGGLLGAVGLLLWLYLSVRLQQTTFEDIGWAFLLFPLGIVVLL